MSDEDIATETNMIMIPDLKINLELQIENYVDGISKLKNKNQLKSALFQIWENASNYGATMERIDKLRMDIDMLQYDISGASYEIEYYVDGSEED